RLTIASCGCGRRHMIMFQLKKLRLCLALALWLVAGGASHAFSLLGPTPDWQTLRRGYDAGTFGPMTIGEEWRWNVPVVYYGFDDSFLGYFGNKGAQEVDKAFAILNSLPPLSTVNLNDYPLDTRRSNPRAQALNLLDLKSTMLAF